RSVRLHAHPRHPPSLPTRRSSDLLARGTARERIDQPISPCRQERAHQPPRGPWKRAKHAFQEVRHRVEGDHTPDPRLVGGPPGIDRKSTRLNSSHVSISYAVFCLK